MAALPALARSARYGDVRGTDTAGLGAVAARMLSRIFVGLARTVHGLDPDAAAEVLTLARIPVDRLTPAKPRVAPRRGARPRKRARPTSTPQAPPATSR